MRLQIPEFSMVCMIGTTGSGKSSFCRDHFLPTEVLSSDTFRGYVCDDENSQEMTKPAFDALHYMLAKRLELGRLTVIDATNVQKESRRPLLKIASDWHALKVAIVLNTPIEVCLERNRLRPNRQFGDHVVRNQHRDLRYSLKMLRAERWHKVYFLDVAELESIEIVREPMTTRRLDEHGPFDIIGDIHGCWQELQDLLTQLGWNAEDGTHPEGRKLVFLGDLVDRGPSSVPVLKFAMDLVKQNRAIWVPGNHDIKLSRALAGKEVSQKHGLAATMEELAKETPEFRKEVEEFIKALPSHAVLDDGKLCVAHAGMRAEMMGRGSGVVREFALYGETSGEIDEFGLPVRYEWSRDYRGTAMVVYGHTPVPTPEWLNRTIDIDTGCCFGGRLTALRYPERELIAVPALKTYYESARPLNLPPNPQDTTVDTLLDLADVTGRRSIETRLNRMVTIREENAIAALEIMSRFAADPRWLIYLPPTMSPCETSSKEGYLEHPEQAFAYFQAQGVESVVVEEKHMGSRAVAVICRNSDVALARFGVGGGETGIITTRTGRRFTEDRGLEDALLQRLIQAAEASNLFDELESDWFLLDAELMPWSAKALGLLREQYAPVGAAARESAAFLQAAVNAAVRLGIPEIQELEAVATERQLSADRFVEAYRRYCWTVREIDDYKIAPFHLLASEGKTHFDRDHIWHMETLGKLCDADPQLLRRTPYRVVDLLEDEQVNEACQWWESLVESGGEGAVFKPLKFLPNEPGGRIQPAIKCRGPEYLRIIYGPEYLKPENLQRLRKRGLTGKRSLALREFALGVESIERFVRHEPLRRVHECVFGVLALESEPVDPRL
jgi:protein phosphatase